MADLLEGFVEDDFNDYWREDLLIQVKLIAKTLEEFNKRYFEGR